MLFLNLTGIDSTATNNYVNNIQAEMTARAGLEYAVYVLNMDKYGTDTVVYNNNNCRYLGTTTTFSDENYDAYTEEWLGTGTGKIFGSATASSNAVDNNGDGSKDSNWQDAPFSLDKGLRAQYAILIEDVGESRINVNATGNIVGAGGSFIYGTGATTYDIRIQDIPRPTTARNIIAAAQAQQWHGLGLMAYLVIRARRPPNSNHAGTRAMTAPLTSLTRATSALEPIPLP